MPPKIASWEVFFSCMRYSKVYKVRAIIGGREHSFDSLEECYFAGWLELMKLDGKIQAWYREGQRVENDFKSVWIGFGKLGTKDVKGTFCDFLVINKNSEREWWEFKGRLFGKDRVKVARMKEMFGDKFKLITQTSDYWKRNRAIYFRKIKSLIQITEKNRSYGTSNSKSSNSNSRRKQFI